MPYEKRDFDFVLFINDVQGNNKRPVVTGSICVGGKDYPIAGWNKVSKNGKKFIAGGLSQPMKKEEPKQEPSDFKDNSIPF